MLTITSQTGDQSYCGTSNYEKNEFSLVLVLIHLFVQTQAMTHSFRCLKSWTSCRTSRPRPDRQNGASAWISSSGWPGIKLPSFRKISGTSLMVKSWNSRVEGDEVSCLQVHNCPTNFVIALNTLSLMFCKFINTTAYHLGKYQPSSPISCRAPRPSSQIKEAWNGKCKCKLCVERGDTEEKKREKVLKNKSQLSSFEASKLMQ